MIGLCPLPWMTDDGGMSFWGLPPGVRSIIDLRPFADCALRGEYGDRPHVLMFSDGPVKADGWETLTDADPRDTRVDQKLRDTWESLTGVRVEGDTLADLIWWHLTVNADPLGLDHCKPLMPAQRQLSLTVHSLGELTARPFDLSDQHANKVLAVLQASYRETFERAAQGKTTNPELHLKLLDDLCDKYRVSKTDRTAWEKFVPPDLRQATEGPKLKATTYTDNFNRGNQSNLGTSAGGFSWTTVSGNSSIVSNQCRVSGGGSVRHEADLSSTDVESQVDFLSDEGGNTGMGPTTRNAGASETFYGGTVRTGGQSRIDKRVAGVQTTLASGSGTGFGTYLQRSNGSTLTLYRNGVSILSTTDTSITSGTRCGMYAVDSGQYGDDWSCTDLAAATKNKGIIGGGIGRSIIGA